MSKFVDEIFDVFKETKDLICRELDDDVPLEPDEVGDFSRRAIENVAKKRGITPSTVADKCTRQLGIDLDTFAGLAKDYLTGKNDDLENEVVRNSKTDDDEDDIRRRMRDIRDKY